MGTADVWQSSAGASLTRHTTNFGTMHHPKSNLASPSHPKWCGSQIPPSLSPNRVRVWLDPNNNGCELPHWAWSRHSCWICDGWLTTQPLHSIVMASFRMPLTTRAIACTNCSWISMEWWVSLYGAAFYSYKIVSKTFWMTHQWWCSTGLDLLQWILCLGCGKTLWLIHASQTFAKRIWGSCCIPSYHWGIAQCQSWMGSSSKLTTYGDIHLFYFEYIL